MQALSLVIDFSAAVILFFILLSLREDKANITKEQSNSLSRDDIDYTVKVLWEMGAGIKSAHKFLENIISENDVCIYKLKTESGKEFDMATALGFGMHPNMEAMKFYHAIREYHLSNKK